MGPAHQKETPTWYGTVRITGEHSNQDQICLVKIGEYIGFYVDRWS